MAITKVSGGILDPGINVAGIVTATGFDGPFTGGSSGINAGIVTCTELDLNGNGNISGNLVVGGNLTANGDFTTLNTTLREVELLRVDANSTVAAGIITQTGSGDILRLYDGSSQVFTVFDTGEVGIGTDNPLNELDVYGSSAAVAVVDSAAYSNGSNGGLLSLQGFDSASSRRAFADVTGLSNGANAGDFRIRTRKSGTMTETLRINKDGQVVINRPSGAVLSNSTSKLEVYNSTQNHVFVSNSTAAADQETGIMFAPANNVYGGKIIVTSDEDFSTTANRTSHMAFYTRHNGTADERLRISSDGKVGIGTVDPDRFVHIRDGGGGNRIMNIEGTANSGAFLAFLDANTTDDSKVRIGTKGGNKLSLRGDETHFETGVGTSRMVITSAGDLEPGANTTYTCGTSSKRWSVVNTNVLSAASYAAVGSIVAADPGSDYYSYNNRIGSGLAVVGNSRFFNYLGIGDTTNNARLIVRGNSDSGDNDCQIRIYDDDSTVGSQIPSIAFYGGNTQLSYIRATNTGIKFYTSGDGSPTFKLQIKNDGGIEVDGEISTSQDYPNFRPTLDFNFAVERKLDPRITYSRIGPASFVNEFGKVVLVSDNAPRFDHDPDTGECKGLLIEESRINLVEDNTNYTGWLDYSSTHAKTTDVKAPDGSYNAWKVTSAGTQSQFGLYDVISYSANTKYTHSMWLKAGSVTRIGLTVSSGSRWSVMPYLVVDLDTGTVNATGSSLSTKLTAYPDGWYLLEATGQFGSSSTSDGIWSYTAQTGGFSGNTTAYFYQWGGQAEAGAFATSFIPTHGSNTTRGADVVRVEGEEFAEFYNNATEHTTVMVGKRLGNTITDGRLYTISDGTANQVAPDWDFNDDTKLRLSTNVGGNSQMVQEILSWDDDKEFKIAAGMAVNNQIGVLNGTAIAAADTSCLMPTGVDRLYFGLRGNEGNQGSLTIKRFMFYPKRLPDSQLVTLTS